MTDAQTIAQAGGSAASTHHPAASPALFRLHEYRTPAGSDRWEDIGPSRSAAVQPATGQPPGEDTKPRTTFTILLQVRNQAELERRAREVSDPRSPQYGKFLSPDEIAALTHAPPADQTRVLDWLRGHLTLTPPTAIENRGDSIVVRNVAVEEVERVWRCEMHAFREKAVTASRDAAPIAVATGMAAAVGPTASSPPRVVHRCVSDVYLPAELRDVVTGTIGLVDFPQRWTGGPHPHPVGTGPPLQPLQPLQPHAQQAAGAHAHPQAAPAMRPVGEPGAAPPSSEGHAPAGPPDYEDKEDGSSIGGSDSLHVPMKEFATPVAHPHRTLRTPQQLARAAEEFERDRSRRQ